MEWRADAILLKVRRHGETAAIVEVFTEEQGRYAGVVRGGASRKLAPLLQPGAQLDALWRARLDAHIGTFQVELIRSRTAAALQDRLSLAGLNAVTALLSFTLPERAAYPELYRHTEQLLDLLGQSDLWPLAYLRWEMRLLKEMGYALMLDECAVTGAQDDLIFVSPKTGRAVSRAGAGEWASRLLPLPAVLRGAGPAPDDQVAEAFETTGYFLKRHLAHNLGHTPLPEARDRFVHVFRRQTSD
ncbi:MAG: DNA repair protein RecO [Pseudomonadota bacterium]